jgi:hypothetical protein
LEPQFMSNFSNQGSSCDRHDKPYVLIIVQTLAYGNAKTFSTEYVPTQLNSIGVAR